MEINTYLNFRGNCREAFSFYEQHLGAKVVAMLTLGEGPMADSTPEDQRDRIMHAHLELGGHAILGTDHTPDDFNGIQGAHLVINVDDPDEAERLFALLSEGGEVRMPLDKTFWAKKFGVAVDRFGVSWMVNCAEDIPS